MQIQFKFKLEAVYLFKNFSLQIVSTNKYKRKYKFTNGNTSCPKNTLQVDFASTRYSDEKRPTKRN